MISGRFPSAPQLLCTGVVVSAHFPGQTLQSRSLHFQKLLFRLGETLIFTKRRVDPTSHRLSRPIWALPRAFRPHLVSSRCEAKTSIPRETSTNFVLPAPQQPPRRPTSSFPRDLQVRMALRCKNRWVFNHSGRGAKNVFRGLLWPLPLLFCSKKAGIPYEIPWILGQSINQSINQSTHQPINHSTNQLIAHDPGPGGMRVSG